MIESDPNASPAPKRPRSFEVRDWGRAPPFRRDKGTIRRTCCASSVLRSNCNGAQLSARAFTSPRARARARAHARSKGASLRAPEREKGCHELPLAYPAREGLTASYNRELINGAPRH